MSENFENDSYDDLMADIEVDVPRKTTATNPSEAKKSKTSSDIHSYTDESSDELLANLALPGSSQPQRVDATQPTTSAQSSTGDKPSADAGVLIKNASKRNCVLVNPKQRGNPILKSITNVPWEFDDSIIPDYVVGVTTGILFLSLRYHQLNPDYIHNRLKELGKRFELRVLLVQVDTKVSWNERRNFNNICNFTLFIDSRIHRMHWKI